MEQNFNDNVELSKDEIIDQLDLSFIDYRYIDDAIQSWEEKDPLAILCLFSNKEGLAFVIKNAIPLMLHGIYEETLLQAFIGVNSNWSGYSNNTLKWLFGLGKRDRFLQAGDPLPHKGPFTLYRGIAGQGARRHKRGISWTSSFENAKWYTERFSDFFKLEKPMVYEAQVEEHLVYTYTNERDENEFLCYIPDSLKLKKIWP